MPLPCCLHKERGLVQMHTTALERDLTMRIRCCAVQQPGGGGHSAHSCAGGGLALRAVSQLGGPCQRSAAIGSPAVGCEVSLSGLSCCMFHHQSPLLRTSDLVKCRHCAAMSHLLPVLKMEASQATPQSLCGALDQAPMTRRCKKGSDE